MAVFDGVTRPTHFFGDLAASVCNLHSSHEMGNSSTSKGHA